jgi:hypothetical protein
VGAQAPWARAAPTRENRPPGAPFFLRAGWRLDGPVRSITEMPARQEPADTARSQGRWPLAVQPFPTWVAVLTSSPHQPTKQAYFQSPFSNEDILAQRG